MRYVKFVIEKLNKHSDAYNYMKSKIDAFIDQHQNDNNNKDESLFKNNFINQLHYFSQNLRENTSKINNISENIKDRFEFNDNIRNQISEFKAQIKKEEEAKVELIGSSKFDESIMHKNLQNYRGWSHDKKELEISNLRLNAQIDDLKSKIKNELDLKDKLLPKGDKNTNKLVLIKQILEDISSIFTQTKHNKFYDFVKDLESRSNKKFSLINQGSFTGDIVFSIRNLESSPIVSVELVTSTGNTFKSNKSLETSMNIAILLAISDLTSDHRDQERFPLLMDAPVSSFGKRKHPNYSKYLILLIINKLLLL